MTTYVAAAVVALHCSVFSNSSSAAAGTWKNIRECKFEE
jgi:hypothetical protein